MIELWIDCPPESFRLTFGVFWLKYYPHFTYEPWFPFYCVLTDSKHRCYLLCCHGCSHPTNLFVTSRWLSLMQCVCVCHVIVMCSVFLQQGCFLTYYNHFFHSLLCLVMTVTMNAAIKRKSHNTTQRKFCLSLLCFNLND